MDNKTPTGKDIHKAVSQYLATELGVDRAYVDKVLEEKLSARNIPQLIQEAIARYFKKGPNGYKAEEVAEDEIRRAVREHVDTRLKAGAGERLDAVIDKHIDEITNGTVRRLQTPGTTLYRYAVHLDWAAIDEAMNRFLTGLFGERQPVSHEIKIGLDAAGNWCATVTTHVEKPADLRPLYAFLSQPEQESLEFHMKQHEPFLLPANVLAKAVTDYAAPAGVTFTRLVLMDHGLLCLPDPEDQKSIHKEDHAHA